MVTSTLWLCFWVNSGPRKTYEPNSRRDLMSTEQEVHRAITFLFPPVALANDKDWTSSNQEDTLINYVSISKWTIAWLRSISECWKSLWTFHHIKKPPTNSKAQFLPLWDDNSFLAYFKDLLWASSKINNMIAKIAS